MRVLLILGVFMFTKVNQIKVSGCPDSQVADKYQSEIHNLRLKLKDVYKELNQRQASSQALLNNLIAKEKTDNNNKIIVFKKILSEQTDHTTITDLATKNCISRQYLEATNLFYKNNALECLPLQNDIHVLYGIKGNILKLEKVTNVLVNYCLYLNPLKREVSYLHMCIVENIRHIQVQIPIIELEFRAQLTTVSNSVKKCMLQEIGSIEKSLNMIIYNFQKCKSIKA